MTTDLRWVSCSRKVHEPTSTHRHLVSVVKASAAWPGTAGRTTLCGSSASTFDTWRASSTKPACSACQSAADERGLTYKKEN